MKKETVIFGGLLVFLLAITASKIPLWWSAPISLVVGFG